MPMVILVVPETAVIVIPSIGFEGVELVIVIPSDAPNVWGSDAFPRKLPEPMNVQLPADDVLNESCSTLSDAAITNEPEESAFV